MRKGHFFGLISAVSSTVYVIVNRHVFEEYNSNPFLYIAFVLGAGGLNSIFLLGYRKELISPFKHKKLWMLVVNGLLAGLANGLFIWGQESTTSINAGLLSSSVVITTAIISAIWGLDRYSKLQVFWLCLMFAGIYVSIVGFNSIALNKGDALILIAMPVFGFTNAFAKLLGQKFNAYVIAGLRFIVSGFSTLVFVLGAVWISGGQFLSGPEIFYAYISGSAFFLAILTFYMTVKDIGPNLTIVIQRMALVFVVISGVFLLSETLKILDIIGLSIIIISVIMLNKKAAAPNRRS